MTLYNKYTEGTILPSQEKKKKLLRTTKFLTPFNIYLKSIFH